jgi:hypothetical protein
MKGYQIIMLAIVIYFLWFHVVAYLIKMHFYHSELRRRKTGPPRAYNQPLQKPNFFNIKLKI